MVTNVFSIISSWWMSLDINYQTLIISIIVSIIIFILGYIINEAFRRYNKSTELKQYKQFIEEWIEESKTTLSKYISSIEDFSKKIEKNNELNIPKWSSNIIHVSEINKIPLERFSDIYIFGIKGTNNRKENRTNLMNFLYKLEYLDKAPSLIMDLYHEYSRHNEDIMNEWNAYYLQLRDLYSKIGYNNIEYTDEQNSINAFSKLFIDMANQQEKDYVDLNDWKDKYIDPVLKIYSNNDLTGNNTLLQIGFLTINLKNVIKKHDDINKYSDVFMCYVEDLKNSLDTINVFMTYFKNKDIKRFCK